MANAARKWLDPVRYDYFAGGADDELTVRANEAVFTRLRLLPRVARGGDALTVMTVPWLSFLDRREPAKSSHVEQSVDSSRTLTASHPDDEGEP